jgi:hypothetical protein
MCCQNMPTYETTTIKKHFILWSAEIILFIIGFKYRFLAPLVLCPWFHSETRTRVSERFDKTIVSAWKIAVSIILCNGRPA